VIYRWEIILCLFALLMGVIVFLLVRIRRSIDVMSVTNMPRDGLPEHMEASWEDIGAHGRWLNDLGGMSIAMREQMFDEFCKALDRPMRGVPQAGSMRDVLTDMDAWLTALEIEKLEKQRDLNRIE
jgi:hypothetical protein